MARTRVSAVIALCLIQFVDVMAVTVVVTALPAMLADTGSAAADGALVATGYAMFFGGLLIFGARLGDRFGHRRAILAALGIFAAGALLTATATSTAVLVTGRCVQGVAAAVAVPSALTLLTTITRSEQARARAVAAWSATGAAAGASGFVVGGIVTDLAGWQVIFWAMLGISAALAAAVLAVVPADDRARERRTLNLPGAALLTASVMLIVLGATLLGEHQHRTQGALLLGVAAVLTGVFILTDRRSAAPMLPPDLLGRAGVRRGAVGAFLNTATTSSAATLITLFLQNTLGRSPVVAAATLLPFSVFVVLGSAVAARSIVRRPREQVTAAGLAMIGAGIALPLVAPSHVVLIGVGMAVAGYGLGLSSVATTSMGTDVPEQSRATASGIVNTSPQLGTAVGTAFLLLIAAATTGVPDTTTPTPHAAWLAAAVLALAAAAGFTRLRRVPSDVRPADGQTPARRSGPSPSE